MTTPLDNPVLQEYLNIPEDLSNYTKGELLEFIPEGEDSIRPSWSKARIQDELLTLRNVVHEYVNEHKEELNQFHLGMLITMAPNDSSPHLIYSFGCYYINSNKSKEFSITFGLIRLCIDIGVDTDGNIDKLDIQRRNYFYLPTFSPLPLNCPASNRLQSVKHILQDFLNAL